MNKENTFKLNDLKNDGSIPAIRIEGSKSSIDQRINNLVKENHQISCEWISSEELDKKPELVRTMSVKPPRTNNKIRLVKIGNVDLQPCGGTHVNSTKEIGSISIGKIENKGRMNRRVNLLIND